VSFLLHSVLTGWVSGAIGCWDLRTQSVHQTHELLHGLHPAKCMGKEDKPMVITLTKLKEVAKQASAIDAKAYMQ